MTWIVPLGAATGAVLMFSGIARGDPFLSRLAPYVGGPPASRPLTDRVIGLLSRSVGLSQRLTWAGREGDERAFIVERLATSLTGALVLGGLALPNGTADAGLAALVGVGCGWVVRDRLLLHQTAVRNRLLRADLPLALDLMSIAMIAGEGLVGALARAVEHVDGPLGQELTLTLDRIRAGCSVTDALADLAVRTNEPAVGRFGDTLAIALERGTPVAGTLQERAHDLREEERRALLEAGGRREIVMLLPVVFVILPVIVLFVLYPGLVSIEMLVP